MALTNYTTYDQVRALLGVHDKELTDQVLSLPMYNTLLEMELLAVDADLITQYESARAAAIPSTLQRRFVDVVSLYATYVVGVQALVSAPYFAEKRMSDGNAEKERNDDPFAIVASNIANQMPTILARLRTLFLNLVGNEATAEVITRASRSLYRSTGLAVDPVRV